jgi:hypothetical protein
MYVKNSFLHYFHVGGMRFREQKLNERKEGAMARSMKRGKADWNNSTPGAQRELY